MLFSSRLSSSRYASHSSKSESKMFSIRMKVGVHPGTESMIHCGETHLKGNPLTRTTIGGAGKQKGGQNSGDQPLQHLAMSSEEWSQELTFACWTDACLVRVALCAGERERREDVGPLPRHTTASPTV